METINGPFAEGVLKDAPVRGTEADVDARRVIQAEAVHFVLTRAIRDPSRRKGMKRLLKLLLLGAVVGWIASVVAALRAKQELIPIDDADADEVALVAIFAPLQFVGTSQAFQGGTVDCWYGGGVIDLRGTTLVDNLAHLRVRAIFGGGQILVPESWRVTVNVRGIGGVQDTRPVTEEQEAEDAPELVIDGLTIMGGFAIMSELEPEADAL